MCSATVRVAACLSVDSAPGEIAAAAVWSQHEGAPVDLDFGEVGRGESAAADIDDHGGAEGLSAKCCPAILTAWVDWAFAGSQVFASSFWTEPILLPSVPPMPSSSSQNTSTTHLDRLPVIRAM